jgi:hypothetical protein
MSSRLAKRGKGKYKADKSLRDSYKLYVSKATPGEGLTKFSDTSNRVTPLAMQKYKEVAHLIMQKAMEAVLHKSMTMHLPYKLGIIRVKKLKMNMGLLQKNNNLKIDWGHYQKTGKFIKHLNEHRDNCRYGFYWLCKKGPKGKNLYKFQALRQHRRKLADLLKNTNIDYFD